MLSENLNEITYKSLYDLEKIKSLYSNLDTIARKSYREAVSRNDNFDSFYNHDPEFGPLKYVNIKT